MQGSIHYTLLAPNSTVYRIVLIVLTLAVIAGLLAAHHMDTEGHHISGMNNQIVWGVPHVFAIFLIVSASGALNIASIASVFGKQEYKQLSRLSAVTAIALLIGGLVILVLDLGRPDRLIIAMTYYNFKSIFAWNIILYVGFIVIVAVYLWMMMERRMQRFSTPVGMVAFLWRLILTSGTGSIFGFLVARETYDTALLAPQFIVMSFSFGLSLFVLLILVASGFANTTIRSDLLQRLRSLLGIFVAAVFYFVVAFHLTKLYGTQNHSAEQFLLVDGGVYTLLFWLGQLGLGTLLPLILLYAPSLKESVTALKASCCLIVIGAFAQLYVIIIGGQAYPLSIFPGYEVSSSFFDGVLAEYTPSLWELLLGLGGCSLSLLLILLCARVLPVLPESVTSNHAGT